nr:unnamed protein product [Callosobruchus analis]
MHFTPETNEKAKCNICHIVYSHKSGTTSNLRKHMRIKHPTIEIEIRRSFTNTESHPQDTGQGKK